MLKDTNGESVLIQLQPFGRKDQRSHPQSDLVKRYNVCKHVILVVCLLSLLVLGCVAFGQHGGI